MGKQIVFIFLTALLSAFIVYPVYGSLDEDAWEGIDQFSVPALKAFATKYPAAKNVPSMKLRIALLEKIDAVQTGKDTTRFVIPFVKLGAMWEDWQTKQNKKGTIGYNVVKKGNAVEQYFMIMPGDYDVTITFGRFGMPMAPTVNGSLLGFKTNGLKCEWLNKITLVSEDDTTLYFGVVQKAGGLVHLQGKGRCIMPDGKEMILR